MMQQRDIVVIGAGLTGLSTAFDLKKKGRDVVVLEKQNRIGGQIQTHTEEGFTSRVVPTRVWWDSPKWQSCSRH